MTSPRQHVVVIGASLAGLRTAEALRSAGYDGALSLIGDEAEEPYNRPPLSKSLLSTSLLGGTSAQQLKLPRRVDGAALDARWHLGRRPTKLHLKRREVELDDAERLSFDGLVIATGARARRLPRLGDVAGVHSLRSVTDALQLRAELHHQPSSIVVIGAGFIGSEVASTVRMMGLDVTLVDAASVPMQAALGEQVGAYCAGLHVRHGVQLRLGAPVRRLEATRGRVRAVHLHDGSRLEADVVVLGLGAVPNIDWLHASGLLLDGGVRTDASLRVLDTTGRPVDGVVAAGDVVRWPHPTFDGDLIRVEHWSNAVDQAGTAARTLLHELTPGRTPSPPAPFTGIPSFWSDQYDAKILAVGLPPLATVSAVLDGSVDQGRFIVGYGRGRRLIGAVAVNHPRRLAALRRQIADRGSWPPTDSDHLASPTSTRSAS